MLTKERIARIKECKKLVVKLPLETAIQLEKTENDLVIANQENKRLREALKFYADGQKYTLAYDSNLVGTVEIFKDKGKKARQVLGDVDE